MWSFCDLGAALSFLVFPVVYPPCRQAPVQSVIPGRGPGPGAHSTGQRWTWQAPVAAVSPQRAAPRPARAPRRHADPGHTGGGGEGGQGEWRGGRGSERQSFTGEKVWFAQCITERYREYGDNRVVSAGRGHACWETKHVKGLKWKAHDILEQCWILVCVCTCYMYMCVQLMYWQKRGWNRSLGIVCVSDVQHMNNLLTSFFFLPLSIYSGKLWIVGYVMNERSRNGGRHAWATLRGNNAIMCENLSSQNSSYFPHKLSMGAFLTWTFIISSEVVVLCFFKLSLSWFFFLNLVTC